MISCVCNEITFSTIEFIALLAALGVGASIHQYYLIFSSLEKFKKNLSSPD